MKITENYLKKIIGEEAKKLLNEEVTEDDKYFYVNVKFPKPLEPGKSGYSLKRTVYSQQALEKAQDEIIAATRTRTDFRPDMFPYKVTKKFIGNDTFQVIYPKITYAQYQKYRDEVMGKEQETPVVSNTPTAVPNAPAATQAPIAQAPNAKPALQPNSKVKHTKSGTSLTFIRSEGNKAYVTDGTKSYKVNIASLTPELQESKIFKTSYVQQVIKEETAKYLKEMKIKFNKGSLEELDMYKAKAAYRGGLEGAKQGLNVGHAMAGPQIGGLVGAAIGGVSGAYNAYKDYDANQQNLKKAYTRQMDDYYSRTAMSDPDNPPVDPDIGGISGASLPKPTPKPVANKPMPKPAPKPVAKPPPVAPTEPPDEVFEPENYLQVQGKGKLRFKPQK